MVLDPHAGFARGFARGFVSLLLSRSLVGVGEAAYGTIPPELWNRLGTRILTKMRSGADLTLGVEFSVRARPDAAQALVSDLRQALDELGLGQSVQIE